MILGLSRGAIAKIASWSSGVPPILISQSNEDSSASAQSIRQPVMLRGMPLPEPPFPEPILPGATPFWAGTTTSPSGYVPRQESAPAHPTNYGERFTQDANGRNVSNDLIVVIHETVGSASSAINTFQTPHPRDEDQVSYHSLIKQDGTVVYIVPPEMRAFGAGSSVFEGANGSETVQTNPAFASSVNNFAYHTSLESPADGRGNSRGHSGYTEAQYQSLAWVVAQTHVANQRITTHQAVDRSGTRRDPRSFNAQRFIELLNTY
ncbi:MAG: N-acetylmuramoyl-L-alanine amidase [Leptolyngbyaceae cyanobacterium SM1_4_3]|nr:N-acetylmuramoyl-L-alanine amidase [Leptolyngbyaceae cyanobacterium SM1_4_3]